MARVAARLLAALALLLAVGTFVQAELLAIPPLVARIVDQTGILSREQVAALETQLAQFESRHGSQMAILLVASTQPETIEAYSIRVVEAWKLGRKGVDDGVLIVVAKNDRKLRIEVGRGLEGAIPDAVAKRIVADVIGPRFKAGDFYGGLQAGVNQLEAAIGGESLPVPGAGESVPFGSMDRHGLLIVGLFVVIVLGAVLGRLLGRLIASTLTSGVVGTLAWWATASLLAALLGGFLALLAVLMLTPGARAAERPAPSVSGGRRSVRRTSGGGTSRPARASSSGATWGSDSGSSGSGWSSSSSDSSFSGGGGDFGGGGASGDW